MATDTVIAIVIGSAIVGGFLLGLFAEISREQDGPPAEDGDVAEGDGRAES